MRQRREARGPSYQAPPVRQVVQCTIDAKHHRLPCKGRRDTAWLAVEKALAQHPLHLRNSLRKRGLGQADLACSRTHAARAAGDQQCVKVSQVELEYLAHEQSIAFTYSSIIKRIWQNAYPARTVDPSEATENGHADSQYQTPET